MMFVHLYSLQTRNNIIGCCVDHTLNTAANLVLYMTDQIAHMTPTSINKLISDVACILTRSEILANAAYKHPGTLHFACYIGYVNKVGLNPLGVCSHSMGVRRITSKVTSIQVRGVGRPLRWGSCHDVGQCTSRMLGNTALQRRVTDYQLHIHSNHHHNSTPTTLRSVSLGEPSTSYN